MNIIKPRSCKSLIAAACLAAVAFPSLASAQATVVYLETFGTPAGANGTFGSVGWSWYSSAAATNRTNSTTGTAVNPTAPTNTATANIGQAAAVADGNGYGFFNSSATSHFGFTTEYNGATPLTTASISEVSFVQGNAVAYQFRVAIQTGGNWYVTTTALAGTVADQATFTSAPTKLTFSGLNTASWSALSFTAGSALSIGSAATLPGNSTITGFGLYATTGTAGTGRFDDFTVTAIPEPSTFAALAGLGVLGLAASRRRRQ